MNKSPVCSLHFITLDEHELSHTRQVLLACKAGIEWVQLRMKQAGKETIFSAAREARGICSRYHARLIINDHLDIAMKCRADGVHLGNNDMPVDKARELAGPGLIIGGTANTPEEALVRALQGASYIGAGPFRFTHTKKNLAPILGKTGLEAILEKLQGIAIPVIAVGGITMQDLDELLRLPLHGIAVSGIIARSPDPGKLIKRLTERLRQHHNTLARPYKPDEHAKNC